MVTSISKVHAVRPSSDPRIAALRAADQHRFDQVYAMAVGELRRMAGMTPDERGMVDPIKLDRALAGQSFDRRLRLKSMLAECGILPR
jgi:hypothetical protein